MSGELAASFVLKLNDQGSAAAERAIKAIERAFKATGEAAKASGSVALGAFQKLSSARETLGIRAEKVIRNEIHQTEAAYKRMADSGQASARELARAQDAMRQKVSALRKELDGVNQSAGRFPALIRAAGGAMAAWQAGKYALGQPIGQTMSYDRSLANLANTAYAGQATDVRRAGMRTLDAAVVASVRRGGGTREQSVATLDKLIASGAFSDINEATALLPVLTRAGTASNADPALLADIAIRAKQTFGLTNTSLALDQAMKAGQLGGFELKDMAKWLPAQMAAARQSGLKGDEGFRVLLAANQATAITAGTKDEAGNNLVNLLAKINSRDTAMDAQRLGIDLSGSLAAARGKGVNSLDAFANLVEQIVGKDQRYVALRAKAQSAKGDEQRASYEAMGDILQGSSIGKIVQDRQALMALLGIMNNRSYMTSIRGQLGSAQGTADDAFGLISDTPSYKAEQLAAEKAIGMQAALNKVNPLLGGFAEGLTGVMRDWPTFSSGIVAASTALYALALAAGAAGLVGLAAGGTAGSVATRAALAGKGLLVGAGALATGAAGSFAALGGGGALGAGIAAGGVLLAGGAGYGFGSAVNWGMNKATGFAFGKDELGNDKTLGSMLYDLLNREKEPARVDVSVRVENGNIVASVNEANARNARRH